MKTEMAFGLALKELRRERGLSQEELAAKSDLHRTYISLLERGQKSPSLTTICRLAKALDTRPYQLVLTIIVVYHSLNPDSMNQGGGALKSK